MAGNGEQLFLDFSEFLESTVKPAEPKPLPVKEAKIELTPEVKPEPVKVQNTETVPFAEKTELRPYGAWVNYAKRLTAEERKTQNNLAIEILKKDKSSLTEEDKAVLRSYSGWGGLSVSGERGVLYDYYTSPPIADMTWRLLNKISPIKAGAKVLEPSCGTGVFFEAAPKGLNLRGIELDERTAAVAAAIHPEAKINHQSYEQFNISGNSFNQYDYIIGNAPFGERTLATAFLDLKDEKSLDRYFISRSIDNLKSGGVLALIVHSGVMANKTNEEWRLGIARKAQFLGGIKLNDHSFHHTHTQIQPDILFFKKHPEDIAQRLSVLTDDEIAETVFTNWMRQSDNYFGIHPDHVMGTISEGTGQWGHDEVKGTATQADIEKAFISFVPEKAFDEEYEAARKEFPLPEQKAEKEKLYLTDEENQAAQAKELALGSIKLVDKSVYTLDDSWVWKLAVKNNAALVRRLEAVQSLTSEIKAIRSIMREGGDASNKQESVKEILKSFKDNFRTYPKDDTHIIKFLKTNPAVSGVYDAFIEPDADILNVPNLYDREGKLVNGHSEAVNALFRLQEQLQEGDEETIRKVYPDTADELISEMYRNPDIFLSLDGIWQLREDFISGNAWEKIDALEKRAADEQDEAKKEKYLHGKTELEKAIGYVSIEDADFTPHSSWIPEYIINRWVTEPEGLDHQFFERSTRLSKNDEGKWGTRSVSLEGEDREQQYSGPWEEYTHSIAYFLNMQKQRSKYIDTETFNQECNENFKNYIANHREFRDLLERQYNRIFKSEIARPVKTYPVYLEGWRDEVKSLRGHQWQTIHHLYRQGKGISALGTGFGKTLAGTGLHTLLLQEGKIKRAWFQVPNNKVKDWVKEIQEVLPKRKIGFIDPEMKGYSNREKRYAKYQQLASGDYEIIIMPESAAGEIQLNYENDRIITAEVVSKHIQEKGQGQTDRSKENIAESAARQMENGKTNRTITFEDFGCNAVFVDEAHRYKNLFTSSLSRETGLNDGRQSNKALALFKKTEYIRRNNDGKNVFLLTATPLTNSPLEYYNMLMYVAPEELERFHIHTIDGFIRNFADIRHGQTYDWKTGQIANKRILTGFKNIQTLQDIFFKYTDYQNDPEKINLDKPTSSNKPNLIPNDDTQVEVIKSISAELDLFIKTPKKERASKYPGQNFLTFYSEMRTASLDLELYNPDTYEDWNNPKLKTLAQNAWTTYTATQAGQLVFCDRVLSSDESFNIHDKIKRALIEAGFAGEEIVIVNGFTKSGGAKSDTVMEKEVSQAVEAFNSGKYKVLIGSTACIGEGLNLQENSSALHHFDIPYRPSDFIQRNGRVDRQGNAQENVELNTYMSAGTIDNYSVSLVQRKANWIDTLLKTKSHVFVNPDDDNFVDADELLLALTEEWGDADKAAERRAEMARIQAEKLKEAQNSQRKEHLASLALLRGALQSVSGDKKGLSYQSRIKQIASMEKALKNNPTFQYGPFIDGKTPFLYAKNMDQIIQKGDIYYRYGNPYEVVHLDFKKQIVTGTPLRDKPSPYGYSSDNLNDENKINKLAEAYSFSYYSKLGDFNKENILKFDSPEFYAIEDVQYKERHYEDHLECVKRRSEFKPVIFCRENKSEIIRIRNTEIEDYEKNSLTLLNPFNAEDYQIIKKAMFLGPEFESSYRKEMCMETLKEIFPELHKILVGPVETVPQQMENEERSTEEAKPLDTPIGYDPSFGFKENVMRLARSQRFTGDPMGAAKFLINSVAHDIKAKIRQELFDLGCTDPEKTKSVITSWVLSSQEHHRPAAAMER